MILSFLGFNKIKLIAGVVIIALLASGFFYVRYLQSSLRALEQENKTLVQELENSNKALDFLREDLNRQQRLLQQSRDNIRRIERERADLERRLRERGLANLARENPALAREEIKKEMENIFSRLENNTR